MNELRDSPIRPMLMWNAPAQVMVNCYRLDWPRTDSVDYHVHLELYMNCSPGTEFGWVAWSEQLLIDEHLQDDYRPGGLWYDSYEYAKAGEWTIPPRKPDLPREPSPLLREHLERLGFASVEALARAHFGRRYDRFLRELQLERLSGDAVRALLPELVHLLVQRGWLVHADPRAPWERQVGEGHQPLRAWPIAAQDLADCLRVHLSRYPPSDDWPQGLCGVLWGVRHFSFAWVGQGRHRGDRLVEGPDEPGSLWYDGVPIAAPGQWR
ncbi:MAG: hypothetical protein OWQ56_06445 [Acidithiobacillus caldus]|nr:hypothetical protein [Acidithiobacillus caldus]